MSAKRIYKVPILLYFILGCLNSQAQLDSTEKIDSNLIRNKAELLTNGFIDIMNNGQVNASARLVRLLIGEPGKFAVPLSIYSGVSANNFQASSSSGVMKNNDHLFNNFINPLSGLMNVSLEGIWFRPKARKKLTKTGLIYHVGERVLTGIRPGSFSILNAGRPINFLNSFGAVGIYFQTGAWERNNFKNVGVCWIAARYIGCYSSPEQLMIFLPDMQTDGFFLGYSLGFGIEINKLVNLKLIHYKYTQEPPIENPYPIYQFSFNYSLKS